METPDSRMFSMPVASGLSPRDSANSVEILPRDSTVPRVGGSMPAMTFSIVVFPAPFSPISPIFSPRAISALTSSRAVTIIVEPLEKLRRPPTLACSDPNPVRRMPPGDLPVRGKLQGQTAETDRQVFSHPIQIARRSLNELYVAASSVSPMMSIANTIDHDSTEAVSPVSGARTSSR